MVSNSENGINHVLLTWPQDLHLIRITENEKDLLEKKICATVASLQPNINSDPSITVNRSHDCPRRLYIKNSHYFVILNNHGGLPNYNVTGGQQKNMKYVWDCKEGAFWLKKRLFSTKQIDCIKYLKYTPHIGRSAQGFPKIDFDYNPMHREKLRYFEKIACTNLPVWIKNKGNINFFSIGSLQDALKKIHKATYKPIQFVSEEFTVNFDFSHQLFHGDISPGNVLCEKIEINEESYAQLMLTDFFGLGNISKLVWTKGWASPETIQFFKKIKYQDLTVEGFLSKYGAKKDTWAFALLIGSLLRIYGFHPKYKLPYPAFSFITNKLKFDAENKYILDESEIANITQEEIDTKLDSIIENIQDASIKNVWGLIKALLIVDPDKRPTLAECFITIE